jgi:phospholipid transport system substrate-binding protein
MKRRALLAAICALPFAANAQTADNPASAAASGPAQPIADLNAGLIAIMHAGRAKSFADRAAMLRPVVEKAFDLKYLARSSVGSSRWGALPADQQNTLLEIFTQFTVASYVANFDDFNGEKFIIDPDSRKVENDVVVPTRIVATNGDVTKLDYVMRNTDAGWRVVDILLDGAISRVAVTRSDFRALIEPGDASKLIDSLRSKVAKLSAGTAS